MAIEMKLNFNTVFMLVDGLVMLIALAVGLILAPEYAILSALIVVIGSLAMVIWLARIRLEQFYDFYSKLIDEVGSKTILDATRDTNTDWEWKSRELDKMMLSDTVISFKFWRSFESFISDRLWFYLYGGKN
jgi:hypothetical protein